MANIIEKSFNLKHNYLRYARKSLCLWAEALFLSQIQFRYTLHMTVFRGNISQIETCFISYFSSNIFKSLASVAGLQLTYTIFFGEISNKVLIAVWSQPLLGGSTKTTFGFIFLVFINSGKVSSTFPCEKFRIFYIV